MLDDLKRARNSPAVLKHRLVELRGQVPKKRIFVFEGDDDRVVYFCWIKRAQPELDYEPFSCKGKKRVLALKDVVERDKSNLSEGVYFFVDRDFDDLQGRDADDQTYMTKRYSVENYLVLPEVLDEVLKTDFHCHGAPKVREEICAQYSELISRFASESREANERIFTSRALGLELISQLPSDCKKIASVRLTEVLPSGVSVDEWIQFQEEPSQESVEECRKKFSSLIPLERYRGKFFYDFFRKWVEKLAEDYRSENPVLLSQVDRSSKVRTNEISIGSFAVKSQLPEGLEEFLASTREVGTAPV